MAPGKFLRTPTETITMVTKKAMVHMLLGQPFFSSMVMPMELIETDQNGYLPGSSEYIPVMATDSKRLIFNPYHHLRNMTLEEIVGVMVHEAAHVALAHHLRMESRDPMRWNIAADYEINNYLTRSGFVLPAGVLIDHKWDNVPAEVIYKQLPNSPQNSSKQQQQGGGQSGQGQPGQGQGQAGQQGGGNGQVPAQDFGKVLRPENPASPCTAPTQEQIEAMKADLAGRLIQAEQAAKRRGNMPGCFSELIHDFIQPKMDWKEILAAFAARVFQTGFTWRRTSTKLLSQGILMPAPEMDGIGALVIAIDTSGSIGKDELRMFAGEVQEIVEKHKPVATYVIYCDAKVQRVDEYKPGDTFEFAVTGRGGTRFEPVFEYVEQEGLDVEAIIYFTDMYGSFPTRHPAAPTLWISTSGTKFEVPFGDVIAATTREAAAA